jgi:hypothetical protein
MEPYILKAHAWGYGEITTLPRDVAEIPTDLLTPSEREWNRYDMSGNPVWVRTSYGPGTDARWLELLESCTDGFWQNANNARRYDVADDKALFAFFPFLLEAQRTFEYYDPELPDDAPDIRQTLYMTDCVNTTTEEERLTEKQDWLFVADDQAMRTGFVEWRMFDEYGNALFKERLQPWGLRHVIGLRVYQSPQDFRERIAKGYYGNDPRYSDDVVQPWEPPAEDESDESLMSAAMQNPQVLEASSVSSGHMSNSESSEI